MRDTEVGANKKPGLPSPIETIGMHNRVSAGKL
jgi:hypothetical protein